jgi:hypothetical protein
LQQGLIFRTGIGILITTGSTGYPIPFMCGTGTESLLIYIIGLELELIAF